MDVMPTFVKTKIEKMKRVTRRYLEAWRIQREVFADKEASALFDPAWYVSQGGGGSSVGSSLRHYLAVGGFAGLSPHPLFDSRWYLEQYPDVHAIGMNPLVHYLLFGALELRDPSPYFDAGWYVARYPDVALARVNPLLHYSLSGANEMRDPNPVFDAAWYVKRHPEVMSSGMTPLAYFVAYGAKAGHIVGEIIDLEWYSENNPDIVEAGLDPLTHYIQHGRHEGRSPVGGDDHFEDIKTLRRRLAGVIPAFESSPATAVLEIADTRDVVTKEPTWGGRIVLQKDHRSAEGVAPIVFPPLPYVALLPNAFTAAGSRYVLFGDRYLLHDEDSFYYDEPGATVKHHKARRVKDRKFHFGFNIRQAAWVETGINLMHEYSNNYFHFLVETLPRLMLAEEAGLPAHVPFLFEERLHENMQLLLGMVNVSNRPVRRLENGTLFRVGQMYIPSDVSVIVDAYYGGPVSRQSVLDVERIRQVAVRCKDALGIDSAKPGWRKIYASRGGPIRKLLNQDELQSALEAVGFETVKADSLSLEEQIRIFSEASVIVGPTGAQITNIAWCPPDTKIVVLASDHPSHQLYLWELLGRVPRAHVKTVQGPRAYVRQDKYSLHDDYSVDIDEVLAQVIHA
jgi:capsular polysaccharide biosynthesis protein